MSQHSSTILSLLEEKEEGKTEGKRRAIMLEFYIHFFHSFMEFLPCVGGGRNGRMEGKTG